MSARHAWLRGVPCLRATREGGRAPRTPQRQSPSWLASLSARVRLGEWLLLIVPHPKAARRIVAIHTAPQRTLMFDKSGCERNEMIVNCFHMDREHKGVNTQRSSCICVCRRASLMYINLCYNTWCILRKSHVPNCHTVHFQNTVPWRNVPPGPQCWHVLIMPFLLCATPPRLHYLEPSWLPAVPSLVYLILCIKVLSRESFVNVLTSYALLFVPDCVAPDKLCVLSYTLGLLRLFPCP